MLKKVLPNEILKTEPSPSKTRPEDVSALAELGIDELVIVAAPPHDVGEVPGWAADLAQRWLGS